MKKVFSVLVLLSWLAAGGVASAAEQATSEVGITFYHSKEDQKLVVPLEKVIITKEKNDEINQFVPTSAKTSQEETDFPQTNETPLPLLNEIGSEMVLLGAAVTLWRWKNRDRNEGTVDEKS